MPDSFALYSMCSLLMRIWVTVVRIENPTVTATMTREGITNDGANRKICVTYNSEVREVSPVFMTMPKRRLQS